MKLRKYIPLLIPLAFMVFLGISCISYFAHHLNNRRKMLSDSVYQQVAKDLALCCQSVGKEISTVYDGDAWVPPSIKQFKPRDGRIAPDGAQFEMHGGMDHYGYRLYLNKGQSKAEENSWDLFFYTEKGKKSLYTISLPKSQRIKLIGISESQDSKKR